MCRNIKTLYNLEPPANEEEIRAAALQFVRKITGFTTPSISNVKAFQQAIDEVARTSSKLLNSLVTGASPKPKDRNRKVPRPENAPVRPGTVK